MSRAGLRFLAVLVLSCFGLPAMAEQTISHGRFESVALFAPKGPIKSFVMVLSGAEGWRDSDAYIARLLAGEGALVAGIDLRQAYREFEKDKECVYASGDLENLSRFVQAYYRAPAYYPPILVGEGVGSAMAYAMVAQGDPEQFTGAISLDFCPVTGLRRPFCAGKGVRYEPGGSRKHPSQKLAPAKSLQAPWVWIATQGESAAACRVNRDFLDKDDAQRLTVASADRDRLLVQRYLSLVKQLEPVEPSAPGSLNDLPLIELTVPRDQSPDFAVLISGDGGWADLDRQVAKVLQARGMPVVGVDALRYFWNERTPTSVAGDLDRIVRYYMNRWQKQRVLLIGYSQGANVMPFALNRLPAATKSKVAVTALMGLGERADFEFHLSAWMSQSESGLPILPEMQAITSGNPVCIYGVKEDDSLCPKLDPKKIRVIKLPGGHHFDGNYENLADLIVGAANGKPAEAGERAAPGK